MRFALTQETSLTNHQSSMINRLSDELSLYLKGKNYGEDVKYLLIGVITIRPEVDAFFKARKPKYIDFKIIKDAIGNPVEISKNLSWDSKPDYEVLKCLEGTALQSVVAQSIMDSLRELKLPKKVQDFDLRAFEKDLEAFFINKGLIS